MNTRDSRTNPYAGALIHCLDSLTAGCPSLLDDAVPLNRLHDLARSLHSSEAAHAAIPVSDQPSTLSGALATTAAAQDLLGLLVEGIGDGQVDAGTMPALSEALVSLAAKLGAALRKEQAHRIRGLYVIIDPEVTGGRDPLEIATAAVRGGARMLQLRDKLRDKGEILPLATALQRLCQANDVLLIINDHVDLAAALGTDLVGVHVGQTDLPVAQARQVLAPQQVLGRSNREIELLVQSQEMGADHVAFGAIYQSTTKSGGRGPQGVEPLGRAREAAKVPLVAIGGITVENVAPVVEAGADAICVTAAVGAAPDPEAAASGLVEAIRIAGGKV